MNPRTLFEDKLQAHEARVARHVRAQLRAERQARRVARSRDELREAARRLGVPAAPPARAPKAPARPAPAPAREAPPSAKAGPRRAAPGTQPGGLAGRVLDLLRRKGEARLAEVVGALGETPGATSAALSTLLARGLLKKEPGRGTPYKFVGAGPAAPEAPPAPGPDDEGDADDLDDGPESADEDDSDDEGEAAGGRDEAEPSGDDEDDAEAVTAAKRRGAPVRAGQPAKPYAVVAGGTGTLAAKVVAFLERGGKHRSDEIARALGAPTPEVQSALAGLERARRVLRDDTTRPYRWSLKAERSAA